MTRMTRQQHSVVCVLACVVGCVLLGVHAAPANTQRGNPTAKGTFRHVIAMGGSSPSMSHFSFGLIQSGTNNETYVDLGSVAAMNLKDGDYVEVEVSEKSDQSSHETEGLKRVGAGKAKVMTAQKLVAHQRAKKNLQKASATGARTILFVRTNYLNVSESVCSESCIQGLAWTNAQNLNGLYSESSYGALSIPQATGRIVTVTIGKNIDTAACGESLSTISSDAQSAVTAAFGISFSSYDLVTIYTPAICYIGAAYVDGKYAYMQYNTLDAVSHELGHNFGFQHSATDSNNDGTVEKEYGDKSSVMGSSGLDPRGVNAANRIQQGWLPTSSIVTLSTSSCTTASYTLQALQTTPSATTPSVLQFTRAAGGSYYISFRNAAGYDAGLSSSYKNLVHVHWWQGTGSYTNLISTLAVGQSYTFPEGVQVSTTAIGSLTATLSVTTCAGSAFSSPSASPSATSSKSRSFSATTSKSTSSSVSASISPSTTGSASKTATASVSSSKTSSVSASSSLSPSATPSSTSSPSPSSAPFETPSTTSAPSETASTTSSPSASSTPSTTSSASQTASASKTASASFSASVSQAASGSALPSNLSTPSRSATASVSVSKTASKTSSASKTMSKTSSASKTASKTPSATKSASKTPSPSRSASRTASPSRSPSASVSPSRSPSRAI